MNVKERIQEFREKFNPLFEQEVLRILKEQSSLSQKDFESDKQLENILIPYSKGGKRIRAFLIYYFSGRDIDDPELQNICLAMELFHLMALIHDDIIDESNMRHGVPTLHYGMKSLEKNNSHLAHDIAILYGDLFLAKSFEQAALLPKEVFVEFSKMVSRTVRGQYIDSIGMNYPYGETSREELMDRHILKTSWYTFASPARLGAMLSGGNIEPDAITHSLLDLGTLFQIRDDIIDCVDVNQGKEMFADIFENQTTWVTLYLKENHPLLFDRLIKAKDNQDKEELRKIFAEVNIKNVYQEIFTETENRIINKISDNAVYQEKISSLMQLLKLD
jgi:geranylgeranyl pyrophosphate synthase